MDVMERLTVLNDIDHYYRDAWSSELTLRAQKASDEDLLRVHKNAKSFYFRNPYWHWRWWEKKCT